MDPLPTLLSASNPALAYFARRDLLGENVGPVASLWNLPEPRSLVHRQRPDGSWRYPGVQRERIRSREDYDELESFRSLAILVEKYGFSRAHRALARTAEYFFARQTEEGDIRGIYGNQYSPNYSAAIMELLIKAGYTQDDRIDAGFRWLLSVRQKDGGWAIPLRTHGKNFRGPLRAGKPLEPVRTKPFSHLVTGVVLRAFAAHPSYRRTREARAAGELLAGRLFRPDSYPDRRTADYWVRASFPFWFTDIVSALDSLSAIGIPRSHPSVDEALRWLSNHQSPDGSFAVKVLRGRDKDSIDWITLAVGRCLRRFDKIPEP